MNPGITATLVLAVCFCGNRSAWAVLAVDDADNYPYSPYVDGGQNAFSEGQNGGSGFDPWVLLDTGISPSNGAGYVVDPGILGLVSWGMSGYNAMGRGLTTPLSAGNWTVQAQFNPVHPSQTSFAGFNLKSGRSGSMDPFRQYEVLRFGLGWNETANSIGLCLSFDGGDHYAFLDCPWAAGAAGHRLHYLVSWNAGGAYSLSVTDLDGKTTFHDSGTISGWSPGLAPVATLGVAIYGAYNDEKMVFDAFAVVPEPAASAVVALLPAAVVAVRRWRLRHRSPTAAREG